MQTFIRVHNGIFGFFFGLDKLTNLSQIDASLDGNMDGTFSPFFMHCMLVCSVSFVSCVNFLRMLNNVASVNSGLETIDRGDDVSGSANAMQCMLYNVDLRSIMVEHVMISDLS